VADALWELSGRYDVGVWYKRVEEKVGMLRYEVLVFCGVEINGMRLDQLQCRAVEECVKQILEDYKREVESLSEPPLPPSDPAEELLKEWSELQAFGVDWVKKWLVLRDRLVEIASVLRRYPWMIDVIRQRQMGILHPYMVEVYVTKDASGACISLSLPKAYCTRNGAVKETRLELEFSRYETYEDKIREVYRPKGLLAFAAAAREYVKLLKDTDTLVSYFFISRCERGETLSVSLSQPLMRQGGSERRIFSHNLKEPMYSSLHGHRFI
jgi:hypothetical protein